MLLLQILQHWVTFFLYVYVLTVCQIMLDVFVLGIQSYLPKCSVIYLTLLYLEHEITLMATIWNIMAISLNSALACDASDIISCCDNLSAR